ncbi:MAG: restriction endonuclease subunit S [Acidovorax sp.]|uniref:restriction endonuclease subunit S n=1 Tax=Acidovorax sp. TaxID=1872122 RepID=UPI00262B6E7D|nr:restriction endonuclease subunit S [Acidovorax sp.]MDH4417126.1 restriction endonuclease subunit S [Acidovorax sp.]
MLLSNIELLATAPGGVAKLRELILTLAVQGKLVPQDPADEPAGVLLQKIRAEKDRLIAEGKIKRDKPLAEIAEEEKPFGLPEGWEWVRFGDVVSISSGVTLGRKTPFTKPVSLPYLRVANVQRWYLDLASMKEVVVDQVELPRFQLRKGDLLITEGGDWDKVGRTAIWRDEIATCLHQNHVFKARAITPDWNAGWAELFLNSGVARSYFASSAKQTTNLASINMTQLKHCAFPLPPLAEQSRIVTRVEALMRLCDALEAKGQLEAAQHAQLVSTLLGTLTASTTPEELAAHWQRVAQHFDLLLDRPEAIDALEQTLLQLAVRGLLVPQDPTDEPASALLQKIRAEKDRLIATGQIKRDKPLPPITDEEKPFELPMGWEWGRLEQVSIAIVDCPHSTPKFVESGRLCLDTNSFKQGVLLPHKLRFVDDSTFVERNARLAPQAGDLVFAREGSVGESILIPDGVEACLGQRVMLFRFSLQISKEFVRLAVSSTSFLDALLAMHKGIGAKHVNVGDMRNAVIPLPPLPEQSRIVTRVTALRRLCADLRQRLAERQSVQARLAEALVQQQACA